MGLVNGNRGVSTKNLSEHLKRYLTEKQGAYCFLCKWAERNPVTKKVPLEVDHINGDSEDNDENNLRLICPNCHSLSPNFRNLNKGKGRLWRRRKYAKKNGPCEERVKSDSPEN
ncbi:MAG: HNH endonuclease signature motif containing protein [bacterium]|nr:HNH endonuclease signature motif containing protein [bacterium]